MAKGPGGAVVPGTRGKTAQTAGSATTRFLAGKGGRGRPNRARREDLVRQASRTLARGLVGRGNVARGTGRGQHMPIVANIRPQGRGTAAAIARARGGRRAR